MFWPFLAATIIGAGAIKFGALSVMVSVLTLALEVLLTANLLGGAYLIWQRFRHADRPA
jgi:uncharacterized membrane protein